jgi:hypothetical protein
MNYVSPNTIKGQTQALYRKLWVSSREDALAAAGALQLHKVAGNVQPDRQLTVVQHPDPDGEPETTEDGHPTSDAGLEDAPFSQAGCE